jgi:DNA-directed RNA polymerase specialized sigma24 family protein
MSQFSPEKADEPKTAERALLALTHLMWKDVRNTTKRRDLQEDLLQEMALAILMRGDGRKLESYLEAARRRMWKVLKREEKAGRAI